MATVICEKCGTRNADTMLTCRRCTAPLVRSAEASVNILGGVWSLGATLPSNPLLFTGRHTETGDEVLVKRLSKTAALDRSIRSRFLKEASILKSLNHPHLIRVVDVIEEPASPAIVLARPEGQPLSTFLARREHLPVPVAINFGLQLLTTLDYLHGLGVVHRNLTANCVFVTLNEESLPHLMITDFGLARSIHLASEGDASETGTLMGMHVSPPEQLNPSPYMAPELLEDEADSRSDIYSLGVLLFEMISGRLPIGQGVHDPTQLIKAIETESPTILRLLRPEVTAELEETLARMMSKRPDQRFLDISETRAALLSCTDATMVRIPAGTFLRGSTPNDPDARPEEFPQRTIRTDAFFIDRQPVTVQQFQAYLKATGLEMPESWHRQNPPEKGDWPVVHVTWDEASDYAAWKGCRLPTEAEWERAARGPDGRIFPWGNQLPEVEHAQFSTEGRSPVASRPAGASPFGCLDMAGNGFEWVQDWYSPGYYGISPEEDPKGPESGEKKVLRGGSFVHDAAALRCASRGRYAPAERRANHGFRCVWSFE